MTAPWDGVAAPCGGVAVAGRYGQNHPGSGQPVPLKACCYCWFIFHVFYILIFLLVCIVVAVFVNNISLRIAGKFQTPEIIIFVKNRTPVRTGLGGEA